MSSVQKENFFLPLIFMLSIYQIYCSFHEIISCFVSGPGTDSDEETDMGNNLLDCLVQEYISTIPWPFYIILFYKIVSCTLCTAGCKADVKF